MNPGVVKYSESKRNEYTGRRLAPVIGNGQVSPSLRVGVLDRVEHDGRVAETAILGFILASS